MVKHHNNSPQLNYDFSSLIPEFLTEQEDVVSLLNVFADYLNNGYRDLSASSEFTISFNVSDVEFIKYKNNAIKLVDSVSKCIAKGVSFKLINRNTYKVTKQLMVQSSSTDSYFMSEIHTSFVVKYGDLSGIDYVYVVASDGEFVVKKTNQDYEVVDNYLSNVLGLSDKWYDTSFGLVPAIYSVSPTFISEPIYESYFESDVKRYKIKINIKIKNVKHENPLHVNDNMFVDYSGYIETDLLTEYKSIYTLSSGDGVIFYFPEIYDGVLNNDPIFGDVLNTGLNHIDVNTTKVDEKKIVNFKIQHGNEIYNTGLVDINQYFINSENQSVNSDFFVIDNNPFAVGDKVVLSKSSGNINGLLMFTESDLNNYDTCIYEVVRVDGNRVSFSNDTHVYASTLGSYSILCVKLTREIYFKLNNLIFNYDGLYTGEDEYFGFGVTSNLEMGSLINDSLKLNHISINDYSVSVSGDVDIEAGGFTVTRDNGLLRLNQVSSIELVYNSVFVNDDKAIKFDSIDGINNELINSSITKLDIGIKQRAWLSNPLKTIDYEPRLGYCKVENDSYVYNLISQGKKSFSANVKSNIIFGDNSYLYDEYTTCTFSIDSYIIGDGFELVPDFILSDSEGNAFLSYLLATNNMSHSQLNMAIQNDVLSVLKGFYRYSSGELVLINFDVLSEFGGINLSLMNGFYRVISTGWIYENKIKTPETFVKVSKIEMRDFDNTLHFLNENDFVSYDFNYKYIDGIDTTQSALTEYDVRRDIGSVAPRYDMKPDFVGVIGLGSPLLDKIQKLFYQRDVNVIDFEMIEYLSKFMGYDLTGMFDDIMGNGISKNKDEMEKSLRKYIQNLPQFYSLKSSESGLQMLLLAFGIVGNVVTLFTKTDDPYMSFIDGDQLDYVIKSDLEKGVYADYTPTTHFKLKINGNSSKPISLVDFELLRNQIVKYKPINTVFDGIVTELNIMLRMKYNLLSGNSVLGGVSAVGFDNNVVAPTNRVDLIGLAGLATSEYSLDMLQFNGDALLYDNGGSKIIRLTNDTTNQSGSVFLKSPIKLIDDNNNFNGSFSTFFEFKMFTNNGGNNADGIAFVIQTNSNNVGASGGGIGYVGVPNSFTIEFDTWYNNDHLNDISSYQSGVAEHIGFAFNGVLPDVSNTYPAGSNGIPLFRDQNPYYVWVDYNGENNQLDLYIAPSGSTKPVTPNITKTIDIPSYLLVEDAYVGFTAATGGSYQYHDILKWSFVNYYYPNNNFASI